MRTLQAGLGGLKDVHGIPPCLGSQAFTWDTLVFNTPAEAGGAVAIALQDSTCTFTVAPTPVPTPAPLPAAVRSVAASALDGRIQLDLGRAGHDAGADHRLQGSLPPGRRQR